MPDQFGPSTSALLRALDAALGAPVLRPGEADYEAALGGLFSSEASLMRPLCIVQPMDADQVAATLKAAREFGAPATVRGGGLSPLCAADRAVMIDLSAHLGGGVLQGDDARMGGGATMGALLQLLAPRSRGVPIGVSPLPGMGLALRGGVGHLTRSAGLTLDHVRAVEIVVPSGYVLTLSDESRSAEADLWWAVRGAGPHFGVITSVTFRSRPLPLLYVRRLVLTLAALPAYLDMAAALPRSVSASAVLGPPVAGPGASALFIYIVSAESESAEAQRFARRLTESDGAQLLFDQAGVHRYHDLPAFDVPACTPSDAAREVPANPGARQRVFKFEKSPFLKPLDAAAAAGLTDLIRAAPTPLCRIDLQHCGGALGDVAPTATAFWNRSFEWNCPVIGAWLGRDGEREACTDWVRRTMRLLAPYTVGAYSVEIVPGLPETAAEVEQAYGDHLPRLRDLKRRWDPEQRFGLYYPL